MCGIFLCISKVHDNVNTDYGNKGKFDATLSRRGPDSKGEINIEYNGWMLNFIGHVLWTQGSSPTKQPLIDSGGNILLWNGDVFDGKFATEAECDSTVLLKYLSCDENDVSGCFKQLVGPYAFIYWDNKEKSLWFGRDVIGRHSLLWQVSNTCVLLSSTGYRHADLLQEVPAKGLFVLNLKDTSEILELKFLPWKHCTSEFNFDLVIPVKVCEAISHVVIGNGENESEWFKEEPLSRDLSVYRTVCDQYSTVSDIFKNCLEDNEICSRVASFLSALTNSVKLRVNKQPGICRTCVKGSTCLHAKTGILFSGGLDSTIIALLADKYVPEDEPIDLYNVAFQNSSKKDVNFNVPDRKTGEMSFDELKSLRKNRQWNFVKIDVTQEELKKWRNEHISDLIHPLNTVLDDSLGCALWFAARGQGTLNNGHSYTSSARVVLLGMGADEMLGGYMRHRTQFKREKSWKSLSKSLSHDLAIIGHRNLGRDNRVVADHGCQPRLPYLDENVIAFVQSLPPWERCYLSDEMPQGVGDKLLLRLVAWNLGLQKVATYPKRAMQFGSRIANSNEKGNNVSHRL